MTPKEKAEELVDKFYQTTPNEAWYNPPLASTSIDYKAWEQAKQCALIAVDEILEATKMHQYAYGEIGSKTIYHNYWQEVKQEIEKL